MRYRKLTSSGDYSFGLSGRSFHVDSAEGVAQAVATRLRLSEGEWFLNKAEGTPYHTRILGTAKQTTIDMAIKARILETQGVLGIADYKSSVDPDTRAVRVSATITTRYGPATIET